MGIWVGGWVGASKAQRTNVRVVAATNENMQKAIASGKFREDLFYRLSAIPIALPSLRDRGGDIHLLFRKFASDFGEKYRMPAIRLTEDGIEVLNHYTWPGNIRQLKNTVEQISIIETEREINALILSNYLPKMGPNAPVLVADNPAESINERELMYKFLFDMKKDLTEVKKLVLDLLQQAGTFQLTSDQNEVVQRLYQDYDGTTLPSTSVIKPNPIIEAPNFSTTEEPFEVHEEYEETLSIEELEKELIQKALEKHKGKRKAASQELGISERTLYRKIKEYQLVE